MSLSGMNKSYSSKCVLRLWYQGGGLAHNLTPVIPNAILRSRFEQAIARFPARNFACIPPADDLLLSNS